MLRGAVFVVFVVFVVSMVLLKVFGATRGRRIHLRGPGDPVRERDSALRFALCERGEQRVR